MRTPKISILLDSARGPYIPRDFVTGFDISKFQGVNPQDVETCKNPDCEWYWNSWGSILDNARYVEDERVFTLHQDGDLFIVCFDELSEEEKSNFFGD